MRKAIHILLSLVFFYVFVILIVPKVTTAQSGVPCPSAEMWCSELDNLGGCQSPCVRTLTYTGRPHALCKCAAPVPTGSVACGQSCGREQDCGFGCGYCWAANGPPVCKDRPFSPPPVGGAPQPVFCNGSGGTTNPASGKIYTAIGCIPVENLQAFAEFLLSWGMGIAGGIAIILIIYAGFLIITSGGNPQRLQAGKELLTAAVMGLLLLIFGAWVLRLIGIQILEIPGLVQ